MFLEKFIIYIFLTILLLIITKSKGFLEPILNKYPTQSFLLFCLFFRIIPFILIYIVLNLDARSDVLMFYDSAKHAMRGEIVYKDFESAYSPLFAYVTSLPLFIWDNPKAIILEMILLEIGIIWISFRLSNASIFWALFYQCLPASFVLSVLGGQEDIWMWGMVALALFVYKKTKNEFVLGLILGIGFLVSKALFILLFPSLFIFSKRRIPFLAGLICIGIPAFIVLFYNMQWDFLMPIQQANDPRLPNIWSILHPITNGIIPLGPKWINWFGLSSLLFLGFYINFAFHRENYFEFITKLFIGLFAWMMISQQSSVGNYLYAILLPIILFFNEQIDKKFIIYLCVLNLGVVLQAPLWWSMGMPYFHSLKDLANANALAEYILEFCVIIPLIWIIWKTVFQKNKVILSDD